MTSKFSAVFSNLIGRQSDSAVKKNAKKRKRGRISRIEELESREMLSVNMFDFVLPQDQNDLNDSNFVEAGVANAPIVASEIISNELSQKDFDAIRSQYSDLVFPSNYVEDCHVIEIAPEELTQTLINDAPAGAVIVVHTDWDDAPARLGALTINKNLTIVSVSYGANKLQTGAITVNAGTTVNLGGLDVTGSTGITNNGNLRVTESIIANCSNGGIVNNQNAALTVTYSEISGNSRAQGGGIYSISNNLLTIANCVIAGNRATGQNATGHGGGIFAARALTVTNSLIAGNQTTTSGGGIYKESTGTLTVTNCTIVGNVVTSTGFGGGISSRGTATQTIINNTIIALNIASASAGAQDLRTEGNNDAHTGVNNIIGGGGNAEERQAFAKSTFVEYTFDSWNANRWKDWDLHLASTADDAIDRGNNDRATGRDLDGKPRIFNMTVDIGAYEKGVDPPGNVKATVNGTLPAQTIVVTWEWAVPEEGDVNYQITGYKIQWSTNPDFDNAQEGEVGINVRTYPIPATDITSGTTYYVRVGTIVTFGGEGEGETEYEEVMWSKAVAATTDVLSLLQPPKNLRVDKDKFNDVPDEERFYIPLVWDKPDGEAVADSYELRWSSDDGINWTPVPGTTDLFWQLGSESESESDKLDVGTYLFQVVARNRAGVSPAAELTVKISENGIVLQAPPPTLVIPGTNGKTEDTTFFKAGKKPAAPANAKVEKAAGLKNQSKLAWATSVTLTWTAVGATANAEQLLIQMLGPKVKGSGTPVAGQTDMPLVAGIAINLKEFERQAANYALEYEDAGLKFCITKGKDTKKVPNDVYTIVITGLEAGTKYTILSQAGRGGEGNGKTGENLGWKWGSASKGTKTTASTAKFAAPKSDKVTNKGVGTARINWQAAGKVPVRKIDTGTVKEYEVGILVNKVWLFGEEAMEYFEANGIRLTGAGGVANTTGTFLAAARWVKIDGLASQKYTFGVRAVAEITNNKIGDKVAGVDDIAKSAITKFTVAPNAYAKPAIKQGANKAKTFTGAVSKTHQQKLPTGASSRGYEYFWYDDRKTVTIDGKPNQPNPAYKQYVLLPEDSVIIEVKTGGVLSGTFKTGTGYVTPSKGSGAANTAKIGVYEVLYREDGSVFAKSAMSVITVKW